MTKDRILFFTSGDFAVDTFQMMIENGFNIVGLVTSMDKVKYHNKRAIDVAELYDIPTYVVKQKTELDEDNYLMEWIERKNADIFCVISFKKLPQSIIKMAKKCAFNVHASLLPALRGAAPINWAIRLGYKKTGLTAFVLDDKIDGGDIIANTDIEIYEHEKFDSLFKRLYMKCVDFTMDVINNQLQREDWKENLVKQPQLSEYDYLNKATKVNRSYFEDTYLIRFTAQEFERCINSVPDGWPMKIVVRDKQYNDTVFDIKIFDVEEAPFDSPLDDIYSTTSDGKTYIKINLVCGTSVFINKIQLAGKEKMDVKTFLNGFRYFRDDRYKVYIEDCGLEQ